MAPVRIHEIDERVITAHGRSGQPGEGTMRVFRRILHATDFSSASRPALARAIALARQNRAALWVVHALPPLAVPIGGDFGFDRHRPVAAP